MKIGRPLLAALALVLVFAGCPKRQTAAAMPEADIVVARDGSGDYRTIGKAIEQAEDGDVILVKPGRYVEEVEIEGIENVTLLGSGPDRTVIDADGEYAVLSLASDGVTVSGFTLTGGGSHGVYVKDGHHTIQRCLIRGNDDRGVYLSSMFGDGSAVIEHCTIVDNGVSGIYSIADNPKTRVRYCIIAGNGRGIVSDKDEGGMTIEYNVVDNDGENFDRVSEGEGNVTGDPGFVDPDGDDYRLKEGSPAADIDGMGNNAGCF